jgi:hypothetical protein
VTERRTIELRCLEATQEAIGSGEELAAKLATRVDRLYLEGEYPDTVVVAEGERGDGGRRWRASVPIWDPSAGGTRDGAPMPSFVGTLMLSEILEA